MQITLSKRDFRADEGKAEKEILEVLGRYGLTARAVRTYPSPSGEMVILEIRDKDSWEQKMLANEQENVFREEINVDFFFSY